MATNNTLIASIATEKSEKERVRSFNHRRQTAQAHLRFIEWLREMNKRGELTSFFGGDEWDEDVLNPVRVTLMDDEDKHQVRVEIVSWYALPIVTGDIASEDVDYELAAAGDWDGLAEHIRSRLDERAFVEDWSDYPSDYLDSETWDYNWDNRRHYATVAKAAAAAGVSVKVADTHVVLVNREYAPPISSDEARQAAELHFDLAGSVA